MTGLKWRLSLMTALLAGLTLTACDDEETTATADSGVVSCTPECGACEVCDTTGDAPMCMSTCGEGTTCQDGACVAEGGGEVTCDPGCGPCQVCDNSGACVDTCGVGSECVDGTCTALPAPATCDPACGECQACDTSGDAPACIDLCGEGAECTDGACVPSAPAAACDPACGACEACDTSGEEPVCVALCGDGAECTDGVCTPIPAPTCAEPCSPCQRCDTSGEAPACVDNCGEGLECLDDVCQAPAPAACDPECNGCERCDDGMCVSNCGGSEVCIEGVCVRDSIHAGMDALAGPFETGPEVTAACLECHQEQADHFSNSPHWRWAGPTPGMVGAEDQDTIGKKNIINNFCIAVPSNEARCTQCHAGYDWRDDTFDFDDQGKMDCLTCHAQPGTYAKAPTTAGNPTDDTNLLVAARSVGESKKANCGSCHFGAGGGDNVKKGDLGSHLLQATREDDVHMGAGMECSNCHAGDDHQIMGRSVHNVATNGPVNCTDCHGEDGHANPLLNQHAQDLACQTCHIPAFSRNQPTKMNWDWSTAGNKTRGEAGVETTPIEDGTMVVSYDAKKGDFVWMKNVRPEYGWWDGRVNRMTITDQYAEGAGAEDNPIVIAKPAATIDDANAKIWPFKVMRGQQAIDPARRLVIVPDLFGPGGFWGSMPAPDAWSQDAVNALWATVLTNGARLAGQLGADEAYEVGDWAWGYTEMWMGINHEVAPSGNALGCQDCHGGAVDWTTAGYDCEDPMLCARN